MRQATLTRQTASEKDAYLAAVDRIQAAEAKRFPVWVDRIRNAAAQTFRTLPFPTTHDEDWKYTNVAPIVRGSFPPTIGYASDLPSLADVEQRFPIGSAGSRLVFVDGRYVAELSQVSAGRAVVQDLAQAFDDSPDLVEAHLGRYVPADLNAFTALNTSLIEEGALVWIPNGAVVEEPIHLLFLSIAARASTHPRVLISLGRASEATIVETYAALGDGSRFTNAVAEMVLGEGAVLEHYRVVEESDSAYHIETTEVHQSRDSTYTSFSMNARAAIGRNDLHVRLAGEGASCTLNGLSVTQAEEHVDNHTLIDHIEPHGTSRQLYKGVLDDQSRTVFNGKIIVRPDAQRTDAQQANRNLLLSEDAVLDTKPQLEILADDVKCTHGATVGQLDDEMVFYLKSRGLNDEPARAILTYGFASDVVASVRDRSVRVHLDRLLAQRLVGGLVDGIDEVLESIDV